MKRYIITFAVIVLGALVNIITPENDHYFIGYITGMIATLVVAKDFK